MTQRLGVAGIVVALLLAVSCGNHDHDRIPDTSHRFVKRFVQSIGGQAAVVVVQDTKTGACFLWMEYYQRGGLAEAPREVCK